MAETETVTADTLRSHWKPLTIKSEAFDKCYKHSVNYLLKENYERVLYCFECERIEFHDEKGKVIWSTVGSGMMDPFPVDVQVFIVHGKIRLRDKI
ncbi:uncharacterized protein N7503_005656 [Penicillium pulvis]|uniref:uncharacterized protein n=1 Tax=Penicillium pulvis TaxID=1562058 RepID=UPI002547C2CF|nr:uncharacterized protein N7503_005656 [Penicillium pulvis]KAJ5803206.1 hypothetical protein N7503_005656 [Penicillium pulvis]